MILMHSSSSRRHIMRSSTCVNITGSIAWRQSTATDWSASCKITTPLTVLTTLQTPWNSPTLPQLLPKTQVGANQYGLNGVAQWVRFVASALGAIILPPHRYKGMKVPNFCRTLVSWSLTSPFSTNMVISETKGLGWTDIPTQWKKASDILTSTLAVFLFSSHPKMDGIERLI